MDRSVFPAIAPVAPPRHPSKPLLSLRGLGVRFGGELAVDALDLDVAAGETVALVGESGCGKSSTALAVMGLLPPEAQVEGSARFEGRELLAQSPREWQRLRGASVSMIFQEPMSSLHPLTGVGQQVAEALRLHQPISRAAARARAIELLDRVRLPDPARRFDDPAHLWSGGQRQRIMIAMAIACRPRLLIADEPTTALDVTIQHQVLSLIDELRREMDMAVLLITHDLGVVAQWADRVAVMHGGRKLEEGPTAQVFESPAHAYTQGLLGASLHADGERHYLDQRLAEIRPDGQGGFELVRGDTADRPRPADDPRATDAPALLSVRELSVSYSAGADRLAAVRGVSFDIEAGQTLGLVGESGCGKSSLSRAIVRLTQADAGQVLLGGHDLLRLSPRELLPHRRAVQMIFQDPYSSLNPRHRVGEILGHALAIHGVRDRTERERRIAAVLDDVGLGRGAAARYPHEFSGGQRQRIGIARALVLQPRLVICDEPVSALDVSVQAQVLNLLVDLRAHYGLSYLFISHDLAVVRYIADRVMVMQQGRIVESGEPAALWHAPQHDYTRSLLAAGPGRCRLGDPQRSAAPRRDATTLRAA